MIKSVLGYLGEVVTMTNALSPFIVERGEGGGLACLGREVEATNVTSTLLIQMRQDAYVHLDEAILTTIPQLFPHKNGKK